MPRMGSRRLSGVVSRVLRLRVWRRCSSEHSCGVPDTAVVLPAVLMSCLRGQAGLRGFSTASASISQHTGKGKPFLPAFSIREVTVRILFPGSVCSRKSALLPCCRIHPAVFHCFIALCSSRQPAPLHADWKAEKPVGYTSISRHFSSREIMGRCCGQTLSHWPH